MGKKERRRANKVAAKVLAARYLDDRGLPRAGSFENGLADEAEKFGVSKGELRLLFLRVIVPAYVEAVSGGKMKVVSAD
jgi:hypothetical protein